MSQEKHPISRVKFEEFSTQHLEAALRSVPVKQRRDKRTMEFLVSHNTLESYKEALSIRMGTLSLTPEMMTGLTYGGVPVIANEEIPDGLIEVYGFIEEAY